MSTECEAGKTNNIPTILRKTAAEKGYKEKELAEHLHIAPKTMSRKFNGVDDFKLNEIIQLCELLGVCLTIIEKTPAEPRT